MKIIQSNVLLFKKRHRRVTQNFLKLSSCDNFPKLKAWDSIETIPKVETTIITFYMTRDFRVESIHIRASILNSVTLKKTWYGKQFHFHISLRSYPVLAKIFFICFFPIFMIMARFQLFSGSVITLGIWLLLAIMINNKK